MSSSTPVATTEVMFQPVQVGRYELAHRIVMAPLTRSREEPALTQSNF